MYAAIGDDEPVISIHALREESDKHRKRRLPHHHQFQSTLSVRRATQILEDLISSFQISIHALREESDTSGHVRCTGKLPFQSTLSVRRATRPTARPSAMRHFNPRSP